MKNSVKKLPDSKIEIEIEISPEEFERYYQRAVSEVGKEVKIKGFRPGHIPRDVLEKEIGQDKILAQAAQKAIEENYVRAILDNNLEVISKPVIEVLKLAPKNPLIFKAKTTVLPEIKLPDCKKIASSVKKEKKPVKEEEIREAIKWLQKSRTKLVALNREARKGDFVEIEHQSPQVEKGEKKKDSFVLGQGHFIPGFEGKLEGMKSGEERDFSLNVPKDYFLNELAGKEISFKVKMKSVFKMELPEVNDRFAQSLGEFKDLESLKKNIEEGLNMEKERETKEKLRGEILEKIVNSMEWNIPKDLIETEKERLFNEFEQSFSRNPQISFQDYLNKAKKSEEEIKESFLEPAQRNIKSFLVLRKIAEEEKIETNDQEVNREIDQILKKYPDPKTAEKELDLERLKQYTKERIINEKTFQLLEKFSREA